MVRLLTLTVRRAREERLAQVAGSLTFTTVLSLVPLLAVALALFTRFPVFHRFERALEDYLLKGMLPADLSRTVLRYLHQFADNASGLTALGSTFLLVTSVALLLTVENALNQIWAVPTPRPFLKRVGLYLLMLALAPVALGVGLWATSYVLGVSLGLIGTVPPEVRFVLSLGPMLLAITALSVMFRFVPNTPVRWPHAIVGGVLAGVGLELGKRAFSAYVLKFPTYKAVYGTFATVPVLLMWVYVSWLVLLTGALVAANLGGGGAKGVRPGRKGR